MLKKLLFLMTLTMFMSCATTNKVTNEDNNSNPILRNFDDVFRGRDFR